MPHKVEWYIKNQVIYIELWGEQTLEELEESNQTVIDYIDAGENDLIHIIIQDSKLEKLPVSIMQIQNILTYSKHPKMGWVTMVGQKENNIQEKTVEFLTLMLAKLGRSRYARYHTLDQAITHMKNVTVSVDWDTVNQEVHDQALQANQDGG